MRLSKKEADFVAGVGPRPYSLSDTYHSYKPNESNIQEIIHLRKNGVDISEIVNIFASRGVLVSAKRVAIICNSNLKE